MIVNQTRTIQEKQIGPDMSSHDKFVAFLDAAEHRSATKILEFGAADTSFLAELIRNANWASKIELHCADDGIEGFDQELTSAAENTSVQFELVKHVGSEVEINDAVMELASSEPFDAIFISNSPSKESLLTSLLVCHESLKVDGVLALASNVSGNPSMQDAITSFRDMMGDAYSESSDYVFVKA